MELEYRPATGPARPLAWGQDRPSALRRALVASPLLALLALSAPSAHAGEAGRHASPGATSTVALELIEIDEGGQREVRRFELSLEGDRWSQVKSRDEAGTYDLSLRLRERDGQTAVAELSLQRTRRSQGSASQAELSIAGRLERGKKVRMTAVAQAKGQLVIEATLR
jgi:hypothetical protein